MTYVCIENNTVVSVLNYEPNAPQTVQVVQITHVQAKQIEDGTHYFDVKDRTVKVVPVAQIQAQQQAAEYTKARSFLQSTDWQVLRHIRQQHLGIPTSLSDTEYTKLEMERQQAADSIKA